MLENELTLENLSDLFADLTGVEATTSGIGIGDAAVAEYARTLEYGSIAGQKPWPSAGSRTTRAVNPETGEEVIVSIQAPQGFIRVHSADMAQAIVEQLKEPADWLDSRAAQEHLRESTQAAATDVLNLLRTNAPRDSGKLAESLKVVNVS